MKDASTTSKQNVTTELHHIWSLINNIGRGKYHIKNELKGDSSVEDAIVSGLNMLADELAYKEQRAKKYSNYLEVALKSMGDFTFAIEAPNKTTGASQYTFINERTSNLLKSWSKTDKTNAGWLDKVDRRYKPMLIEQYSKAFQGTRQEFEYPIQLDIHKTMWLKESITPIIESNGQIKSILCNALDVSDKRTNDLYCKQLKSLYKHVLAESKMFIYSYTPKSNNLFNNITPLSEINLINNLGVETALDFNVEVWEQLIKPKYLPRIKKAISRAYKNGTTELIEYELKALNSDKVIWVEDSLIPLNDITTGELKVYGTLREITERKIKELTIEDNQRRHELVLKATRDIIWDWDLLTNSMIRSKNYNEALGLSPSAALNEDWVNLVHEEDLQMVQDSVNSAIAEKSQGFWECTYRHIKSDSNFAVVYDRAYIHRDSSGKAIRMVGAMRDITKEKQLEEEREQMTSDLILKNKNLEQFAYIVSHNLRAPVANIIGLSQLIQMDTSVSEETSVYPLFQNMVKSVNTMDTVIKDLNDILSIEKNILTQKTDIQLRQLVEEIKLSLQEQIRHDKVKLDLDFQQAPSVFTIRGYIYSVLLNLITNSIKYCKPDSHPEIIISSRIDNSQVVLDYKDKGRGIDLENGDDPFKLYSRFDLDQEGRGVGLFMVKKQILQLGGTIKLESKKDCGVHFIISIPTE